MDVPAADEKFLKALAVALVDHSNGTFKDIAEAAGVSKATLNRFCGTRANLIEMLLIHASELMNKMIADADLQNAPPLEALQRLVENHLTHREMLVFLVFQWRPDTMDESCGGLRWLPYSDALDAFFLRGQREGLFRIDDQRPGADRNLRFTAVRPGRRRAPRPGCAHGNGYRVAADVHARRDVR